MGIISTAKTRLRIITAFTGIFGFIILIGTISLYNYLCRIEIHDTNGTDPDSGNGPCENSFLACHGKRTWVELSMLGILGSIYQITSAFFVCKGALGMRSWIVGNIILCVYSTFFGFFILSPFPNLMVIYLCNGIVLVLCSFLGYTVKNMSSFEESSMSLL